MFLLVQDMVSLCPQLTDKGKGEAGRRGSIDRVALGNMCLHPSSKLLERDGSPGVDVPERSKSDAQQCTIIWKMCTKSSKLV